jgi:mannose-6-phosphate isomerase-like protein (cupin superfamily)
MHTHHIADAPVNHRGGQASYLLLARGQFGAENLAITWVDCAPGSEQPSHQHDTQEQVYVIVRGRGLMRTGDEEREVAEGTMIFVPPRTAHRIRNHTDAPMTYVSATSPPFDASSLNAVFAYRPQR